MTVMVARVTAVSSAGLQLNGSQGRTSDQQLPSVRRTSESSRSKACACCSPSALVLTSWSEAGRASRQGLSSGHCVRPRRGPRSSHLMQRHRIHRVGDGRRSRSFGAPGTRQRCGKGTYYATGGGEAAQAPVVSAEKPWSQTRHRGRPARSQSRHATGVGGASRLSTGECEVRR